MIRQLKKHLLMRNVSGFLILIVNIPLVLAILFLRRFRERKEFLLIAGLCAGDLIFTFGYMAMSIRRIIELQSGSEGGCLRPH